jgi:hypothetical protein
LKGGGGSTLVGEVLRSRGAPSGCLTTKRGKGGPHRGLQQRRGDADWASNELGMVVTICPHRGSERRAEGRHLGWNLSWWSTGKVSAPFIGPGVVNRAVGEEGNWRLVEFECASFTQGRNDEWSTSYWKRSRLCDGDAWRAGGEEKTVHGAAAMASSEGGREVRWARWAKWLGGPGAGKRIGVGGNEKGKGITC